MDKARLFLHCHHRFKNGKDHCYWSIAEKVRTQRGWVQRHLLYLGEINDSQKATWTKVTEVFDAVGQATRELALYPADRAVPAHAAHYGVQVRLAEFVLRRPRQWGACWVGCRLWDQLHLDEFWRERLPDSREGTCWRQGLETLVVYRLIDPGSEWRLHRQWFQHSAMADLLGADFGLAQKDNLYRCLDKVLAHRTALFGHLRQRWEDLFGAKFEVLLYDLTSTHFESDPPFPEGDKRQYGYSRDKRPDCVQVVIALVVTPEGFPLAYTLNQWSRLEVFLQAGRLAADNNWCEGALRPLVLGRKNWLHIGSAQAGPKVAAIASIVETCRRLDVNRRQYLNDVLPKLGDWPITRVAKLTPTAWKAAQQKKS